MARRYYLDGESKVDIAAELGLSRFKVARLLDLAHADLEQYETVSFTEWEVVKATRGAGRFSVTLENGGTTGLKDASTLLGYRGQPDAPEAIVFLHNGLHFELQIDPNSPIGKTDPAGVKDIVLEAALTTIMDCEDSVAAVDADDKVLAYRNWLGLVTGSLAMDDLLAHAPPPEPDPPARELPRHIQVGPVDAQHHLGLFVGQRLDALRAVDRGIERLVVEEPAAAVAELLGTRASTVSKSARGRTSPKFSSAAWTSGSARNALARSRSTR